MSPAFPLSRAVAALLLLLAALLALPACSSRPDRQDRPGRAVVIYAHARTDDAEVAGRALQMLGYVVELEIEGPATRERSSVSIYDVRRNPARPDRIEDALKPIISDLEYLPFMQPGPGDTDVVVWLVRDEMREAIQRERMPVDEGADGTEPDGE